MMWMHRLISQKIKSSFVSGLVVSFSILIVSAVVVTTLMHLLDLPSILFYMLIYFCHVPAIMLGVMHTTLRRKKRGIFNGIRISFPYAVVVALLSYLLSDSDWNWTGLWLVIVSVLLGAATGMWTLKKQRKK